MNLKKLVMQVGVVKQLMYLTSSAINRMIFGEAIRHEECKLTVQFRILFEISVYQN